MKENEHGSVWGLGVLKIVVASGVAAFVFANISRLSSDLNNECSLRY